MANDLFTWIDALWNKRQLEGTPPIFMIHRFLASDRDMAMAARTIQLDHTREPHIAFRTWQGLLPKGKGSPRLSYVAMKKGPAAEALVERMMHVLAERRTVVEDMVSLLILAGKERELYLHFGAEPPGDVVPVKKNKAKSGGLLGDL